MWQRFLKDYFSFSSADRNGIVVLITLILLVIVSTYLIPRLNVFNEETDATQFREFALNFYANEVDSEEVVQSVMPELFFFDPNQLNPEQMQRLGFDSRLSRTIGNYLSRGGKFNRKEDVLKIYGMTDSIYRRIEPYIVMVKQETHQQPGPSKDSPLIASPIIELNTADTTLLKTLPGIGSVLSGRIVRFRDLLGGFSHSEQLLEVYGISDELYGQINRFVQVDKTLIKMIDIRNASFNELLRHPYISYEQAGKISRFMKGNIQFQNPVILLEAGIIDTISFSKLSPYLLLINE